MMIDLIQKTPSGFEMSEGPALTPSQVGWAARHDWFHKISRIAPGRIMVFDRWVDADGKSHSELFAWLGTFEELRAWAGY